MRLLDHGQLRLLPGTVPLLRQCRLVGGPLRRRLGARAALGGVAEDPAIALRELLLEALDLLPERGGVLALERVELTRQREDLLDELLVFAREHQRGLAEDLDVVFFVELDHDCARGVRHNGRAFQESSDVSPSAARGPRATTARG